jgi:hypothetical protein
MLFCAGGGGGLLLDSVIVLGPQHRPQPSTAAGSTKGECQQHILSGQGSALSVATMHTHYCKAAQGCCLAVAETVVDIGVRDSL